MRVPGLVLPLLAALLLLPVALAGCSGPAPDTVATTTRSGSGDGLLEIVQEVYSSGKTRVLIVEAGKDAASGVEVFVADKPGTLTAGWENDVLARVKWQGGAYKFSDEAQKERFPFLAVHLETAP